MTLEEASSESEVSESESDQSEVSEASDDVVSLLSALQELSQEDEIGSGELNNFVKDVAAVGSRIPGSTTNNVLDRQATNDTTETTDHEGWLLKRKAGHRITTLARASVGTWLQSFFWSKRFFMLTSDQLCYNLLKSFPKAGFDSESVKKGMFKLECIDEVCATGRSLSLHFSTSQQTGYRNRGRTLLCLQAPTAEQAEVWGKAVRSAVAASRKFIPADWDVGAMLENKRGDVRMVNKVPLPTGAVQALQRLVDHSFVCKGTKDRRGGDVPLRLRVVEAFGVQNMSAWTEYVKGKEQICARYRDSANKDALRPPVRTSTLKSRGIDEVDTDGNEHWLFHGSTHEAVQSITDGEFQINLAGTHRGTLYGRGVYLAECTSKADEYAEVGEDGKHGMLLCRVSLGRIMVTTERRPDVDTLIKDFDAGGYDSVCGDRWTAVGTFREFIFYDGNQVYPAYIIVYRRQGLEALAQSLSDVEASGDVDAVMHLALYCARIAENHPIQSIRTGIPTSLRTSLKSCWPKVRECLMDPESANRRIAVVALGMSGQDTPEIVSSIADVLQNDANEGIRVACVVALRTLGSQVCAITMPVLAVGLRDESDAVRKETAKTLCSCASGAAGAVDALVDYLGDPAVQAHILNNIGNVPGQIAAPAVPKMAEALMDGSLDTRVIVLRAFVQFGQHAVAAKDELGKCLRDMSPQVRRLATDTIAKFGADEIARFQCAISRGSIDAHMQVQISSAKALSGLKKINSIALSNLQSALQDSKHEVRKAVLISLGHIGKAATSSIRNIRPLLDDEVAEVRLAAQLTIDVLSLYEKKKERKERAKQKTPEHLDADGTENKRKKKDKKEKKNKQEKTDKKNKKDKKEKKDKKNPKEKKNKDDEDPIKKKRSDINKKLGPARETGQGLDPPPPTRAVHLIRRLSL